MTEPVVPSAGLQSGYYVMRWNDAAISVDGHVVGHVTAWKPRSEAATREVFDLNKAAEIDYVPGKISFTIPITFVRTRAERGRRIHHALRWHAVMKHDSVRRARNRARRKGGL